MTSNVRKVDPAEFARLVEAGASGADIRAAFGITTSTFTYWRNRLGVKPMWWRTLDPERVRSLVADGRTDRQIAAEVGAHVDNVRLCRSRLGLKPNNGRHAAEFRERMRALMAARAGGYAGERKRRHRDAVADLCRRYGLPVGLCPAQVQVVLALAGGPAEVRDLADATGRRPATGRGQSEYHRFCCPRVPGGNHLTALRKAGLVFSVRTTRGAVYSLTPHCMDLLAGGRP